MMRRTLLLAAAVAVIVIVLPDAYASATRHETQIATDRTATNVFVAPALDELAYASLPSKSAPRVAAGERDAIAQAFQARVIVRALPRASSPALVTADRESIGYHPRL
jgi:hypothetical protein